MGDEGSINATAAMMRDKTPMKLGCGRKDKDRIACLGRKRTRKARSYALGLSQLPYLSTTIFGLALFSLFSCQQGWLISLFTDFRFIFNFQVDMAYVSLYVVI